MLDIAPSVQQEAKNVRHTALDILARREHSRVELKRKLLKRFNAYDVVEQVLDRLEAEHLQSDERYAESYVRYRSKAGFGPLRILAELRERGVNDSLSNTYLKGSSNFWWQVAYRAKKKKFGLACANNIKDKARQTRFLQYRGFSSSEIDAAITAKGELATC